MQLLPGRPRQQIQPKVGGADGVGFVHDELATSLDTGGGPEEGERHQEPHQGKHGGFDGAEPGPQPSAISRELALPDPPSQLEQPEHADE